MTLMAICLLGQSRTFVNHTVSRQHPYHVRQRTEVRLAFQYLVRPCCPSQLFGFQFSVVCIEFRAVTSCDIQRHGCIHCWYTFGLKHYLFLARCLCPNVRPSCVCVCVFVRYLFQHNLCRFVSLVINEIVYMIQCARNTPHSHNAPHRCEARQRTFEMSARYATDPQR